MVSGRQSMKRWLVGVAVNQHAGSMLLQTGQSSRVVDIDPNRLRLFQSLTLRSEFTRNLQSLSQRFRQKITLPLAGPDLLTKRLVSGIGDAQGISMA